MVVNVSNYIEFWNRSRVCSWCWYFDKAGWFERMDKKCATLKTVLRWITAVTGWPSRRQLCSTIYMPVMSLSISVVCKNQCTNAHGYFTPLRVNEKKRCTQATSRPKTPHAGESGTLSSTSSWDMLMNNDQDIFTSDQLHEFTSVSFHQYQRGH